MDDSCSFEFIMEVTETELLKGNTVLDVDTELATGQLIYCGNSLIRILDKKAFLSYWATETDSPIIRTLPSITKEAENIIFGDREATYGEPSKNLLMIANLWSAYLGTKLTATQVCDMMILLKVARLKNSPQHRDSMVDIVGYTLLKERC